MFFLQYLASDFGLGLEHRNAIAVLSAFLRCVCALYVPLCMMEHSSLALVFEERISIRGYLRAIVLEDVARFRRGVLIPGKLGYCIAPAYAGV